MAVTMLQVTLSGTTHVSATKLLARWVEFANNAAHDMKIADSTVSSTHGIPMPANGGFFAPPTSDVSQVHDLSQYYVKGTDADVLDVVFDKVGS